MNDTLYYATVGRGLEKFAKDYLARNNFRLERELVGKLIFGKIQQPVDVTLIDLNRLKFFERMFLHVSTISLTKDNGEQEKRTLNKYDLIGSMMTIFKDKTRIHQVLTNLRNLHKANDNDVFETSLPVSDNEPKSKRLKRSTEENHFKTFRICCKVSGRNKRKIDAQRLSKDLGRLFANTANCSPELRQPDFEISINISDENILIGIPLSKEPISKRPYFKHMGLRSTVIDALVHLASIQETSGIVLDPMCGCGTILIEALAEFPTLSTIGCDFDENQLLKCSENITTLKEFRLNSNLNVLKIDVKNGLPFVDNCFDSVISDLPFGQNHLTENEIQILYPKLIVEIIRVSKVGAMVILLTSKFGSNLLKEIVEQPCCKTRIRFLDFYVISLGETDGYVNVLKINGKLCETCLFR